MAEPKNVLLGLLDYDDSDDDDESEPEPGAERELEAEPQSQPQPQPQSPPQPEHEPEPEPQPTTEQPTSTVEVDNHMDSFMTDIAGIEQTNGVAAVVGPPGISVPIISDGAPPGMVIPENAGLAVPLEASVADPTLSQTLDNIGQSDAQEVDMDVDSDVEMEATTDPESSSLTGAPEKQSISKVASVEEETKQEPEPDTAPISSAETEKADWREVLHEESQKLYYWNAATDVTSWDKPKDFIPYVKKEPAKESSESESKSKTKPDSKSVSKSASRDRKRVCTEPYRVPFCSLFFCPLDTFEYLFL